MKKQLVFLILLMVSFQAFAQRVDKDIFGDLVYKSGDRYTATLKKDIFDSLIFTDSNGNELTFEKKYLDSELPDLVGKEKARVDFFRHLISKYSRDQKYKAKYKIDIFDKIVIEDNRNNKTEIGTDIFGNPTYEEKRNGQDRSVTRSLSGDLEYKSGTTRASLGKDVFGKWCYKDSDGNKLEFSDNAWHRLIRRHRDEDGVFRFLIREMLE